MDQVTLLPEVLLLEVQVLLLQIQDRIALLREAPEVAITADLQEVVQVVVIVADLQEVAQVAVLAVGQVIEDNRV